MKQRDDVADMHDMIDIILQNNKLERLMTIRKKLLRYVVNDNSYSFLEERIAFTVHQLNKQSIEQLLDQSSYTSQSDSIYSLDESNNSIKVTTIIDGVVETTNIAHIGDFILCGPRRELYVLSSETVTKNYVMKQTDNQNVLESKPVERKAVLITEKDFQQYPKMQI